MMEKILSVTSMPVNGASLAFRKLVLWASFSNIETLLWPI